MRVALATVIVLLFQRSAGAQVPACPPKGPDADGCEEACHLPGAADEQASEAFTSKLRSIASTRHHIDTVLGDALFTRLSSFRVAPFSLSSDDVRRWTQSQRWAGPCTGLAAVFYSKAVEDKDSKNAIDLYELRYQTEAMARRVAALLETSWDWNYHPFVTVLSGRSVIVAEGRHRDWYGLKAVGEHFGGRFPARRRAPRP